MNLSTPYGPRFVWVLLSDDGYTYRLTLSRAHYAGPTREVVGDGLSISWQGVSGDALSALAPVAASEMRVSLVDDLGGLAGEIEGSPDGAWQGTLHRCANADGVPNAADALEWLGYVLAARRDESEILPGLTRTSLSLVDGLGLLASRPWHGPGAAVVTAAGVAMPVAGGVENVLRAIMRVLGPLGGGSRTATTGPGGAPAPPTWGEVRTAVHWWPRVATAFGQGGYTQLAATANPLAHICTTSAAWLDADRESESTVDALRAILHRLAVRLYQSAGVWRADQRSALARTPAAVAVRVYTASAGTGGANFYEAATGDPYNVQTHGEDYGYNPTPSPAVTENRVVDLHDTPGLTVFVGDARGSALPVRTVESTYGHGPIGTLVVNGSFEAPRPGSPTGTGTQAGVATLADAWVQTALVKRFRLNSDILPGFSPVIGDEYALRLGEQAEIGQPIVAHDARQALPGLVPASPANVFRAKLALVVPSRGVTTELGSGARAGQGGVQIVCDRPDGTVVRSTEVLVTLAARTIAGKDARIYFTTAVQAGAAAPAPASGSVLIPSGTVLYFGRPGAGSPENYENTAVGVVTLLEPYRVGERGVRADVAFAGSETTALAAGDLAFAHAWTTGAGRASIGTQIRPSDAFYVPVTAEVALGGHADDGRLVEGRITVIVAGANAAQSARTYADDCAVTLTLGGIDGRDQDPTATTGRAMLTAGATGTDGSLPVSGAVSGGFPIGDGPLPGSAGALFVLATRNGVSLDPVPTVADGAADWGLVPYATPTPTGQGIEALSASEALRGALWHDAVTEATGPLATMRVTALMRPPSVGVAAPRLRPHHIRRAWIPAALAEPATTGEASLVLTRPARPGGLVRIGDRDSPYTSATPLTVLSVGGGAGGWVVTLNGATVPISMPRGARVWVSVLAWWDASAWDVARGTVSDDLTELSRAAVPLISQTALSA